MAINQAALIQLRKCVLLQQELAKAKWLLAEAIAGCELDVVNADQCAAINEYVDGLAECVIPSDVSPEALDGLEQDWWNS